MLRARVVENLLPNSTKFSVGLQFLNILRVGSDKVMFFKFHALMQFVHLRKND